MKFYTLTTIILISFALNGCILDRIKQRMFAKKQIEKQEQAIEKKNSKAKATVQQSARRSDAKSKKVYKPSKPTAPIYSKPEEVKVEPKVEHTYKKTKTVTKKRVKTVKKKHIKHAKHQKHVRKKVKIKPEPYSIEKDEQDPELLGPQTTMDSNPLTHNAETIKSKKKKI